MWTLIYNNGENSCSLFENYSIFVSIRFWYCSIRIRFSLENHYMHTPNLNVEAAAIDSDASVSSDSDWDTEWPFSQLSHQWSFAEEEEVFIPFPSHSLRNYCMYLIIIIFYCWNNKYKLFFIFIFLEISCRWKRKTEKEINLFFFLA